jgi:non-specific serine/threonine protein kinase/serine/threonine-protein kinase
MNSDSTFGAEPFQLHRLFEIGLDKTELDEETPPIANWDLLKEKPGSRIGPYLITQVLGEGGMGIVYLAQQEEPIRRQVALKVIKPGMDSKRVIARFEAEKQALALMQHPNIAGVNDAGLTLTGRPYFVMEYVKGLLITDYCDHHKLTIEERLGLFVQVCQAVQHAHQKGIIHRDIKSSNILVSVENGRATPKIIDFGVAKAIGRPLTDRTLFTEDSQLLGTPEYMSPEQADMATEDIDTRSDVYSLGVLLYVLLTGALPFDSQALRDSGIENIRKTIRQIDPKTPSTRLTKLGEEAKTIAQNRQTDVGTLARRLHKELEWIPLKAMRKERSERYRSASELADDIENYFMGKPLIAGPLGTTYRLKKLVRRNKTLVTGLIAVLTVLIAGIIVSSVFALKAQRQAQRSDAIVDFLTNDVLGSAKWIMGRDATAIDLLDAAAVKLDAGAFKDQPLTELLVRYRLGNLTKSLGYSKKAIPYLERVQEIYMEHGAPQPLRDHLIMNYLALAYLRSGEREKAESLFQMIIEEKEKNNQISGLLYPWVKLRFAEICRMKARYKESERILLEMMQPQFRNGEGLLPGYMVACMCDLAETYRLQGRYEESEKMYIEAQDVIERHDVKRFVPSTGLAHLYSDLGRHSEAEELLRAEIERIPRERPGKDHVEMISAMNDLAVVLTRKGEFNEAERLFEEVWKVRREKWDDDHPDTLTTINDFGVLRRKQKDYAKAEELLRQALEGRQRKLGNDYPDCFESMHELGVLYKEQAQHEEAEKFLFEAMEGRRLKLGDTHPHTIESIQNLINLYEASNRPEKANQWRAELPLKQLKEH